MTGSITHAKVTGAPANPNALVDGPAWDAAHEFNLGPSDVGLGNVKNVDTTNASNITDGTLPAAQLPATAVTSSILAAALAAYETTAALATTLASYVTSSSLVTTLAAYAGLASPAFTGTPTAPTASVGTNTTQLATTAFVLANTPGTPGTANPVMDGTAAPGSSTAFSRQDHVHPSDTSRAPAFSVSYGLTYSGNVLNASLTKLTASLGANVSLSTKQAWFVGPSVSQGTVGTWFVSGTVTVADTSGAAAFFARLWDGTTLIASAAVNTNGASSIATLSLSGVITSPAGNLRIEVYDNNSASGVIYYDVTGEQKDSTITAVRIA